MRKTEIIRVLHIIGKMNRGGAETFLMELYRNIDKTKVQFDFLEMQYDSDEGAFDEEIRSLGGVVHKLILNSHITPLSLYNRLSVFFEEHNEYTIIHSHQYTMSGLIVCAAKRHGRKTITHAHAVYRKSKLNFRELYRLIGIKLIKKYSDFYWGCSEDALFSLSGRHSDDKKAFIVKNAIEPLRFYYSESERESQRKKYGLTDEKVVGCVGRFSTVKNQKFLVRVFAKAAKRDPKLVLVFVGDGEKEEETKAMAQELSVFDRCIFMGLRSDVYNVINLFDAFCLPSLNEGLGIVYIEAQCNGLNCIAPLETVPIEADIGAGLLKRVPINANVDEWAKAILNASNMPRANNQVIRQCMKESGYDINYSIKWIQDFYIKM